MQDADYIRIPLHNRTGDIVAYALVDAEDATLAEMSWYRDRGYAMRVAHRDGRQKKIVLHRVVLGLTSGDGLQCDHINGDRLDCRRDNLRVVSSAQNAQNKGTQGGTSEHRGVSWDARSRKWQAHAMLNGRGHNLGRFDSEQEAADVASAWRLAHMPYTNEDRQRTVLSGGSAVAGNG